MVLGLQLTLSSFQAGGVLNPFIKKEGIGESETRDSGT
jgi:hypothetical protein